VQPEKPVVTTATGPVRSVARGERHHGTAAGVGVIAGCRRGLHTGQYYFE
jgi:hypothetical protein